LLELNSSGIHVAEYLTVLPPKETLKRKLQAIKRSQLIIQTQNKDSKN